MKRLLCLLLLGIMNTVFADNAQYADPTKPIIVKAEQPVFSIRLKSNRTTGYQWIYDADHSSLFVAATHEAYQAPSNTKLMGAPGYEIWTFTVQKAAFAVPTTAKITLLNARPWDMAISKKMVITVVSQPEL